MAKAAMHPVHSSTAINAGVLMLNSSERMKNWQVPGTDLFQYGQAIARPKEKLETKYYQVQVIYNREVKVGLFKKESIPFIFSSPMICRTKDEAVGFAKEYIYSLIKNKDLPEDVVKFGNVIDEDKVRVAIQTLDIALMEKDVSDK